MELLFQLAFTVMVLVMVFTPIELPFPAVRTRAVQQAVANYIWIKCDNFSANFKILRYNPMKNKYLIFNYDSLWLWEKITSNLSNVIKSYYRIMSIILYCCVATIFFLSWSIFSILQRIFENEIYYTLILTHGIINILTNGYFQIHLPPDGISSTSQFLIYVPMIM